MCVLLTSCNDWFVSQIICIHIETPSHAFFCGRLSIFKNPMYLLFAEKKSTDQKNMHCWLYSHYACVCVRIRKCVFDANYSYFIKRFIMQKINQI